jgi:hypothetical protein
MGRGSTFRIWLPVVQQVRLVHHAAVAVSSTAAAADFLAGVQQGMTEAESPQRHGDTEFG